MIVSGLIKFAFFYIAFVVIRSLINEVQKNKKTKVNVKKASKGKDTFEAEYRVIK